MEGLGKTVADTKIVETLRTTLRKLGKQRRELLHVANLDIIKETRVGEVRIRYPGSRSLLRHASVFRQVGKLALVVVDEQLESLGSITHRRVVGIGGDADHAGSRERGKLIVLELLADQPGDEITSRLLTPAQAVENTLSADLALQGNLNHTQRFRKTALGDGGGKDEKLVSRRIAHKLQVVGRVLVVTGDIESDHLLEELF